MRPARPASLLALSLLLSGGALVPASGQTGWVDPPARGAAPQAPARAEPPAEAKPALPPGVEAPQASAPLAASRPARQAATEPAEPRARRTARRRPARRLAETPPPAPAAPQAAVPQASAPEARLTDWAGAAQALTADYLGTVSAPGARIVSEAPRFYAPRVRFFGREMSLPALMAEKRSFARRWPERSYEPRGMRTACNGALGTCIVRTQVEFRAASPGRGALSSGLAELVLEVSLAGPRPVIVSETSRVLRRGGMSALAPSGRNA